VRKIYIFVVCVFETIVTQEGKGEKVREEVWGDRDVWKGIRVTGQLLNQEHNGRNREDLKATEGFGGRFISKQNLENTKNDAINI